MLHDVAFREANMRRCHITLESWMYDDLGLSGPEMIAFAIIYGFSQDGRSLFLGSRDYIATWCDVKIRKVQYILNDLVDKKFIERVPVPSSKTKGYRANIELIDKITREKYEYLNSDSHKFEQLSKRLSS